MVNQTTIYCPHRGGLKQQCETPNACAGGADCRRGSDPLHQTTTFTPCPICQTPAICEAEDCTHGYYTHRARKHLIGQLSAEDRATMFIEWCALSGFLGPWPKGAYDQLVGHIRLGEQPFPLKDCHMEHQTTDVYHARVDGLYRNEERISSSGPGFENICRECFGCTIEWPNIRRCVCGTKKRRQEPFRKSRAMIADAIKEIEGG